jgi:hypothetical protein
MGTSLVEMKKKMAAKANKYTAEEAVSGSFFSTAGGILKLGDEEMPGNEMVVVILDAVHENTYYPGKYDPEVLLPPKCFAFGRSEKEMEPHENVLDPDDEGAADSYFELQADLCSECEFNEWGSADVGKGKACTNRRRLAVIPAGRFVQKGKKKHDTEMEVFEEPSHYKDAEIAFLKLPPTSTKAWGKFVHDLQREHQLPPFGVLTHIWLEPDPKSQFKVMFDLIEVIDDEETLEILMSRNTEAEDTIVVAYDEPSDEEQEAPKAKAKKGISGLRKNKKKRD